MNFNSKIFSLFFIINTINYISAKDTFQSVSQSSFIIGTTDVSHNTIYISFNQSLTLEKLSIAKLNDYNWSITGEDYSLSGKGDEIFDVLIQKPGNYSLILTPNGASQHSHDEECNHSNQIKTIDLVVLPISFNLNFDKATFTQTIHGGVDVSGSQLIIPSKISVFPEAAILCNELKVISSGVNASISGRLTEDASCTFVSGSKSLNFNLSGSADADTYIMFDVFLNNILIDTYYLPTKISH